MKLSVGKTRVAWIRVGLSVALYATSIVLFSLKSYTFLIPLVIACILLGYALVDFKYLREKPIRLAVSYVILIWGSWVNMLVFLLELESDSDNYAPAYLVYGSLIAVILSIYALYLFSEELEPVPLERKEHLEEAQNNIAEIEISNNLSAVDLENPTSHLKLSTPLKRTFSLLLFVNILALMALPFKQYVPLTFAILVFVAAAILPLSKYLRVEPGRMSLAYIVLLNGSSLMILPAARIGYISYDGVQDWVPLASNILLPALLVVSFLIYFPNRVNVNPIVKGILRKMYYERESRINAFNQLSENEAKKYKSRLYLTIFVSLTILNAIALVISKFSNALSPDEEFSVFTLSGISYATLAVFTLKRFIQKARLYPLMIYHFSLLIAVIPVYRDLEEMEPIAILSFTPAYLLFIGLAFVAYEIHRNIGESKFVWRDDAMPQWVSGIKSRH